MGEALNREGDVIGQAVGAPGPDALAGLKVGRIVYFVFTEDAADQVNRRRLDYSLRPPTDWSGGAQAHVGNVVRAGEHAAAVVTRVFTAGVVNLKVMLDGADTYWATSVRYNEAHDPGTWHWMFEGQNVWAISAGSDRTDPARQAQSPIRKATR